MTDIKKHDELTAGEILELDTLIKNEFGHIPFISQISWATPDWSARKFENNNLVSFYNLVSRQIAVDGKQVSAMGISNVITPAQYRGHQFAFNLLKTTQDDMLYKMNAQVGLLLCADELIPFYSRLGWQVVSCPVYYNQDEAIHLWKANTMLYSIKEISVPVKQILLNGSPW